MISGTWMSEIRIKVKPKTGLRENGARISGNRNHQLLRSYTSYIQKQNQDTIGHREQLEYSTCHIILLQAESCLDAILSLKPRISGRVDKSGISAFFCLLL